MEMETVQGCCLVKAIVRYFLAFSVDLPDQCLEVCSNVLLYLFNGSCYDVMSEHVMIHILYSNNTVLAPAAADSDAPPPPPPLPPSGSEGHWSEGDVFC
jgi:hypothetical protein